MIADCGSPAVARGAALHTATVHRKPQIVSGCGVFSVKGNEYNLSVGDGFLVVPSCVASYAADTEEPWEYCWVGFNGSDAKQLVDQTGLNEENPVFHYEHDGKLEGLLTDICNVSDGIDSMLNTAEET